MLLIASSLLASHNHFGAWAAVRAACRVALSPWMPTIVATSRLSLSNALTNSLTDGAGLTWPLRGLMWSASMIIFSAGRYTTTRSCACDNGSG